MVGARLDKGQFAKLLWDSYANVNLNLKHTPNLLLTTHESSSLQTIQSSTNHQLIASASQKDNGVINQCFILFGFYEEQIGVGQEEKKTNKQKWYEFKLLYPLQFRRFPPAISQYQMEAIFLFTPRCRW